jgi:hypothetical protein
MKFRFIALTASLLAIAACTESSQMPSAPDDVRLSAADGSNGVEQSIGGNADIMVPEGLRRMTIQARKADGVVTGTLTVRQEWDGGIELQAEIVCFTIVDNKAYVGAVLKTLNGEPVNGYTQYRLVLVDNGEGSQAAPDESSRLFDFPQAGQPQLFCQNASLVLPMFPLHKGNLQIRP